MTVAKKPLSELRRLTEVIRKFAEQRQTDMQMPISEEVMTIVRECGAEEAVRLTFENHKNDKVPDYVIKAGSADDAVSNYIERYVLSFDHDFVHPMLWPSPPPSYFIDPSTIASMNVIRENNGYLPISCVTQEIDSGGALRVIGPRVLARNVVGENATTLFHGLSFVTTDVGEELDHFPFLTGSTETLVKTPQVWVNDSEKPFYEVGNPSTVAFPAGAKLYTVKLPLGWEDKMGKTPREIRDNLLAIAREKAAEAFGAPVDSNNEFKGAGVVVEDQMGQLKALVVVSGVVDLVNRRHHRSGFNEPGEAICFWTRWLPTSSIVVFGIENKPKYEFRGYSREEYLEIANKMFREQGVVGMACSSSNCFVGVISDDVVAASGKTPTEIVDRIALRYYSEE